MIVVDTNVLARIIVNDEPAQAARATAFLRVQDRVLIPKTVVLELEWVLRAAYRLTRETISAALRQILDSPTRKSRIRRRSAPRFSGTSKGLISPTACI